METYSLWLTGKNKPELRKKQLSYKLNSKTVVVKTLYSGISKGTEKLVSSGSIDKDQYQIMQSPFQEGSFSFPIKYGYINVGKIVDGPKKYIGKKTFCLFPHQSYFEININNLTIINDDDIRKYLLTANMETAINIFWDSKAEKKDKIIIVGMGTVGILTAYYFKFKNFKNVYISDINIKKKKFAKLLGFNFINFVKVKEANIVINTTSSYEVLYQALKILKLEGKFIEASWYGSKKGTLSLGSFFHSRRLKIISSQVSNIPKYMNKKYNYKSRLKLAIKVLGDKKLSKLITSESEFEEIKKNYISIINDPNTLMHAIKYK